MDRKVIIIELDGATWDIIDPLICRGELPTFRLLKEKGTYGEVNTSYRGSPTIWTAIFTGKRREKFGDPFFGVNQARIRAKRIWEIAAENGLRVGICHPLLTWPPAPLEGFVIPDIFAMGPETYPAKYRYLQKLYLSRHGNNAISQSFYFLRSFLSCGNLSVALALLKFLSSLVVRPQVLNTFHRRLMVVTRLDHNFFLRLFKKYRPQMSTFHLHALDTISHKYWQFMNKPGRYDGVIADFYREADRFLSKVLQLVDQQTSLVVVADHGFQEYNDGRGKFELNVSALRDLLNINTAARVVRMGNAFVMNLGAVDSQVDALQLTQEIASAKLQEGYPLFVNVKKIDQNIHFRLNKKILTSRDPMEELVSFRGAGQLVFGDLFHRKAFVDTGIHAAGRGLFAVYGPQFLQNTNIHKVEIFDITPTLLTLLDLPIAKDMDGDIDRRWFTPQALRSIEPRYISTYETEEKEKEKDITEAYTEGEVKDLEERLKMLGYM
jgi:predicted AlkP superfamily phosphohydrolase/phosphomutase